METVFVIFMAVFSFFFMILMFIQKDRNLKTIFGMLALILCFTTAGSSVIVHKPYQVVIENTADNSMTVIEEGTQEVTVNTPMSNLFYALGFFCLVYLFIVYLPMIRDWLSGLSSGYGRSGY